MGVQAHDDNGSAAEKPASAQTTSTQQTYSGSGAFNASAPSGSRDFLSLVASMSINQVDPAVEPYLEKVASLLKSNLPMVTYSRLTENPSTYIFVYEAKSGKLVVFTIKFMSAAEKSFNNYVPASASFRAIMREIHDRFRGKDIIAIEPRIIFGDYKPDMDLAPVMADTIYRAFIFQSGDENFNIRSLKSAEFVIDNSLSVVKQFEKTLSPHGVRPRLDFGVVVFAKVKKDQGVAAAFIQGDEYEKIPVGVIGGYTEMRGQESVDVGGGRIEKRWRPVFNITVCNSLFHHVGVAAILMAAIAPVVVRGDRYLRQWQDLSAGRPNPGFYEEDRGKKGAPYVLKTPDELRDFAQTFFTTPYLAIQIQEGKDIIPGLFRFISTDPAEKNKLMNALQRFFNSEPDGHSNFDISVPFELRSDGVFGDPNGVLQDSRLVDYLYLADHQGAAALDPAIKQTMIIGTGNATDRARVIDQATGSFVPVWATNVSLMRPEFFNWTTSKIQANGMVITDPDAQELMMPISSLTGNFGSMSNVASPITSSARGGGFNFSAMGSFG